MITLTSGPTGKTLYAMYADNLGLMLRNDNSTFEAFNAANWLLYVFALTEVSASQRFSRTTPAAITAGTPPYSVDVRLQSGASAAITDPSLNIFPLVDQLMALPLVLPGTIGGLDLPIMEAGTMQAGSTASTAVLRSGASATSRLYDGHTLQIVGGTGAPESRPILYYNGGTKTATIKGAWPTTPDNTSVYIIRADDVPVIDATGDIALTGSTATTLNLNTSANATTDGYYNGATVKIAAGTGAGQAPRTITAYNHTTQVATVDTAWATTPDATSVYRITFEHAPSLNASGQVQRDYTQLLPAPRAITSSTPDNTVTAADAEWAAMVLGYGQASESSTVTLIRKTPAGTTVRTWAISPAVTTPTTIS